MTLRTMTLRTRDFAHLMDFDDEDGEGPSKFSRNGLGPVKEGEAQYAVVHCTGYIKAWPPAGEQSLLGRR
ncbi:Aryl hydrocarbon receptor nuclear translocator 2 [Myotis davidii]|uniref:Aryl hydrocarbon receptor nuclear translocator 2 n=1 Tax=Myotis davidii TaxID=225400 RepID=L5LQJ8_MYODS|nr:Aryl hydrocarbon receptor nuclear translocator 2 [Myotis davidii]